MSAAFVPRKTFPITSLTIPHTYFHGHHAAGLKKIKRLVFGNGHEKVKVDQRAPVGRNKYAKANARFSLGLIDLVIECREYRVAQSSTNELFQQEIFDSQGPYGQIKRLIVYTKRDLGLESLGMDAGGRRRLSADRSQFEDDVTGAIRKLDSDIVKSQPGTQVFFFDDKYAPATERLLECLKQHAREQQARHGGQLGLRCLLIGLPNVGKSTLLNTLRKKGMRTSDDVRQRHGHKVARVGSNPGVTRDVSTMVKIIDEEDVDHSPAGGESSPQPLSSNFAWLKSQLLRDKSSGAATTTDPAHRQPTARMVVYAADSPGIFAPSPVMALSRFNPAVPLQSTGIARRQQESALLAWNTRMLHLGLAGLFRDTLVSPVILSDYLLYRLNLHYYSDAEWKVIAGDEPQYKATRVLDLQSNFAHKIGDTMKTRGETVRDPVKVPRRKQKAKTLSIKEAPYLKFTNGKPTNDVAVLLHGIASATGKYRMLTDTEMRAVRDLKHVPDAKTVPRKTISRKKKQLDIESAALWFIRQFQAGLMGHIVLDDVLERGVPRSTEQTAQEMKAMHRTDYGYLPRDSEGKFVDHTENEGELDVDPRLVAEDPAKKVWSNSTEEANGNATSALEAEEGEEVEWADEPTTFTTDDDDSSPSAVMEEEEEEEEGEQFIEENPRLEPDDAVENPIENTVISATAAHEDTPAQVATEEEDTAASKEEDDDTVDWPSEQALIADEDTASIAAAKDAREAARRLRPKRKEKHIPQHPIRRIVQEQEEAEGSSSSTEDGGQFAEEGGQSTQGGAQPTEGEAGLIEMSLSAARKLDKKMRLERQKARRAERRSS